MHSLLRNQCVSDIRGTAPTKAHYYCSRQADCTDTCQNELHVTPRAALEDRLRQEQSLKFVLLLVIILVVCRWSGLRICRHWKLTWVGDMLQDVETQRGQSPSWQVHFGLR